MAGASTKRGVSSRDGSLKTDRQQSRKQREQDTQQSEADRGRKERGRIGARAEARQEEPRLVLIEWLDSFGCSSTWRDAAGEAPPVLTCYSVGWLLHDTDDCKVVIPHWTSSSSAVGRQACGDMTIPARAIVRITRLNLS